jgi:hypothetical protein
MSLSSFAADSDSGVGFGGNAILSGKRSLLADSSNASEESGEMDTAEEESHKEIKSSAKSYPHVPPRVDAESYQAELPELTSRVPVVRHEGG